MKEVRFIKCHARQSINTLIFCLLFQSTGRASDWTQYRGSNMDGTSADSILTTWPVSGPPVLWRNTSISNGFSCMVVSQGQAFALMSREDGAGYSEYCVAMDALTGDNLWATPIDQAPWDPTVNYNGGDGSAPYNTGDGPRTTPSVAGDRVIALSGSMHLVCMDVVSGGVLWNDDLINDYGASTIGWDNAASPCVDDDLVFVSLNSSFNNQNLAAFRTSDGGMEWSSQNETVTHTTPIVTTLYGTRQVIFATRTGLVSLDRTTGDFLWKFTYPFAPIDTSMGAGPIIYSNIVYCTAAYARGAAAARVQFDNNTWTVTRLWYKNYNSELAYRSIWMTPVCYQGYIYQLCGENSTFLYTPLSCIDLSTGALKWSVNNFGMGGLILADSNLLVLTEDGQLVLAQPNPNAYTELARYQAFNFTYDAPGKCWQHPTVSNGRIYAHSTREAVSFDVSVSAPAPPRLMLLAPIVLNSTDVQLSVSTVDGSPIDSTRLTKIEVHASDDLNAAVATWPRLTEPLVLDADGIARLTNNVAADQFQRFFIAVEAP
jgi:outer membrane protein assembly factor BamB